MTAAIAQRFADAMSTAVPTPDPASFPNTWRTWIAENLILGGTREELLTILVSNGLDPAQSVHEIDAAARSPYLKASDIIVERLKKRDWILKTYAKLHALSKSHTAIARRHRLSVEQFFDEYYFRNTPVIVTGMIDDWPALQCWNPAYFKRRFSDRTVSVQFGRNANPNYEVESRSLVRRMPVGEYVDLIDRFSPTNDFYLTANNHESNGGVFDELAEDVGVLPYLDANRGAGMPWLGPAGTITPLHHDLTNNLMIQICGRKRLRIVAPYHLPDVRNHVHVFSSIDFAEPDDHAHALIRDGQALECVIGPGDILFLPIGWWHFVEALDVSITMTHTNFIHDNDFVSFYRAFGRM